MDYAHYYEIDCPGCKCDLRDAPVQVLCMIGDTKYQFESHLDSWGKLEDNDEGWIAQGYHSNSYCANCGFNLANVERSGPVDFHPGAPGVYEFRCDPCGHTWQQEFKEGEAEQYHGYELSLNCPDCGKPDNGFSDTHSFAQENNLAYPLEEKDIEEPEEKKFFLTGDILYPGVVYVYAANLDEAIEKAEKGDFEVFDRMTDNLSFNFGGHAEDAEGNELA